MAAVFEQQRKFFMNREFTDYRVICNGTVVNVHKVILATHSEVFIDDFPLMGIDFLTRSAVLLWVDNALY